MRIGIIEAGRVGKTLGEARANAGHDITDVAKARVTSRVRGPRNFGLLLRRRSA